MAKLVYILFFGIRSIPFSSQANLHQAFSLNSKDNFTMRVLANIFIKKNSLTLDKNITINFYRKYEQSGYENAEYKIYACDRRHYLKEQVHLSK